MSEATALPNVSQPLPQGLFDFSTKSFSRAFKFLGLWKKRPLWKKNSSEAVDEMIWKR